MPLARVQSILKKALPDSVFDSLYNRACNAYDVYQSVLDNVYYYTPTLDTQKATKKKILRAVHNYTMTSRAGLSATYAVVIRVERDGIEGDLVECGVARGGCAAMMALITAGYKMRSGSRHRRTWLFDSYEGLPEQSAQDGEQKPIRHKDRTANDLATGYCLGTYELVSQLVFGKLRLSFDDVRLVKGWFQDTLPEYRDKVGKIAVLRLDGDWYESTKCCLENLYENVTVDGWIIIDDYQLPGCKKAVDEFLADNKLSVSMSFDVNGRAYWRKT